ncbi:MAG: phospholipid carrier-dependent glycosyltransferase [Candidatus Binatia bacterium]|nr:phospholipid carrier-dependent glycosyltransferase [Candidatus Binatia bacterium]
MTARNQKLVAFLGLLVLAVLYLAEIGGYPLQDPDEGRYAEIPREMIESGDWVTPKLNYVVYFEKPPLFYWLVALSFEAFGTSAGAARAVPALAGILTVVMTFFLGQHLLGRRGALFGAGILASSPIFFVLAEALTIDMVLTACMTATMACFYGASVSEKKSGWVAAVAISAALGVLAKGPVGLVLPGLVALVFLLWRRDWSTLGSLLRPTPILLFVAIVVPWFVLVSQANPEFLHFFFVRENFQRFTAEVGHPEGPFYYIPVLLGGPLPWTALAIGLACTREGRACFKEVPSDARFFLLLWGVVIIAFFTAASSKLATYILPALPPLALVAGGWLDRVVERTKLAARVARWLGTLMFVVGLIALAAAAIGWPLESRFAQAFGGSVDDVSAIVGAVARTGLAFGAFGFFVGRSRFGGQQTAATAMTLLILGVGLGVFGALPGRQVVKTSEELAQVVDAEYRDGDLVVLYRKLWQGMPFYTQRRVGLIRSYGEVWHGVSISPEREEYYWADLEPLIREWNSGRRVFVLTNRDLVPEIAKRVDSDPRLLGRDRHRVVVVNFPATGDGEGPAAGVPQGDGSPSGGRSGG